MHAVSAEAADVQAAIEGHDRRTAELEAEVANLRMIPVINATRDGQPKTLVKSVLSVVRRPVAPSLVEHELGQDAFKAVVAPLTSSTG